MQMSGMEVYHLRGGGSAAGTREYMFPLDLCPSTGGAQLKQLASLPGANAPKEEDLALEMPQGENSTGTIFVSSGNSRQLFIMSINYCTSGIPRNAL